MYIHVHVCGISPDTKDWRKLLRLPKRSGQRIYSWYVSLCIVCILAHLLKYIDCMHVRVYVYMCRILTTLLKRWSVNLSWPAVCKLSKCLQISIIRTACSISMCVKTIYSVSVRSPCNEENHAGVSYPTMSYICKCPNLASPPGSCRATLRT